MEYLTIGQSIVLWERQCAAVRKFTVESMRATRDRKRRAPPEGNREVTLVVSFDRQVAFEYPGNGERAGSCGDLSCCGEGPSSGCGDSTPVWVVCENRCLVLSSGCWWSEVRVPAAGV